MPTYDPSRVSFTFGGYEIEPFDGSPVEFVRGEAEACHEYPNWPRGWIRHWCEREVEVCSWGSEVRSANHGDTKLFWRLTRIGLAPHRRVVAVPIHGCEEVKSDWLN